MFRFENKVKIVVVKDIKTQLKDGKGKLGLVLECYEENGTVSEIEIPNIDLNLPELEFTYEDGKWCGICKPSKRVGYIGFEIKQDEEGNMFMYRQVKRKVTKEQLEKELGYKLDIQ